MEKRSKGLMLSESLLLVFIVLKLTEQIDWSWWWVLSPLWIPIGVMLLFLLLAIPVFWFTRKKVDNTLSERIERFLREE